jgi:hypothetical protein
LTTQESELEVGLEVSTPSLPGLPSAKALVHWRRRRERRAEEFFDEVAEAAGTTVEDLIERVEQLEDRQAEIFERAGLGASETADERKRHALARVAHAALAGDNADVDAAQLRLAAILPLEGAHIRALVFIGTARGIRQLSQAPQPTFGQVRVGELNAHLATDEATTLAVLRVLEGRALIEDPNGGGQIRVPQGGAWSLTGFGVRVLEDLLDRDQPPVT